MLKAKVKRLSGSEESKGGTVTSAVQINGTVMLFQPVFKAWAGMSMRKNFDADALSA